MTTPFTPHLFVAAAVPFGKQRPEEAAYHSAAAGLDDESLRMVFSVHQRHVFFIAARSQDFLAHPQAVTRLAAALPGMPGHHGDGAYMAELDQDLYGVVVKQEMSLKSLVASEADATAFALSLGAGIYILDDPNLARPWQGYRTALLDKARGVVKGGIWVGSMCSAVMLALLVVLGILQSRLHTHNDELKTGLVQALQQASQSFAAGSTEPVMQFLHALQHVSAIALVNHGRVLSYKLDKGHINYELELPAGTPESAWRSLGAGVTATPAGDGKLQIKQEGGTASASIAQGAGAPHAMPPSRQGSRSHASGSPGAPGAHGQPGTAPSPAHEGT